MHLKRSELELCSVRISFMVLVYAFYFTKLKYLGHWVIVKPSNDLEVEMEQEATH